MGNMQHKSENKLKNINAAVSLIDAKIGTLRQTQDQQYQDLAKLSKEAERLKGKVGEKLVKDTQDYINSIIKKVICQPQAQGSVSARRQYFYSETLCQKFEEDLLNTQTGFLIMEPKTPNDILKLMGNKCEEFRNIEQLIQITIFSGGEKNSMLEMAQFIVETVQRIQTYLSKPPQISVPHDTTTREAPMDHMCASEVTSLHSDRNDPGNGTESNKDEEGKFAHIIASVELFVKELERDRHEDRTSSMKTLSSYGETLSPYLKSSNPATVISTESKLSEIDVLWIKICNNQELKKIFQYGNLQTIWKNVNYMEQVVDEFCDSRDSDHYRNISQYLWNYEIYLQANKIVKSDEKIELISKIKYISKCFGSKTSRHGNVLSSRIGGNNSNGSRDNTNMSKAKVNNCENEEQSKQPQDAKQRALKIVEAKVAEDEKTQRALRGREHDEKKKEIEIKLDGIEKKRNEIKQEIYKFVGTTSDPKLHELSEYSVRLILEMDDLNLPRGSDLHTRKIKMLKEVYQYSDILAKKAMENEFVQIETYIAHFEENFEYFTKSENLGECRDGIENIKMRLRGINASVGLEERKSKCMEVTNNMQEILETIEYADRSKREEESTISSEQIEKNDAKMPNNELTKDGGNCEIASKSLEYSIGLKDHGLSNIERKEEELDYIEKVIPDYDPQEIIGKFKQLSLDNRVNTSRSMDLINETKKLEGEASDKNERSASLSDKLGNGSLGIIAKLKKTIFESFERKIQNINEKIHSAHSCGQCDALKEELIKLDAQLEPYIFKNGDAVKRNELRRTIHDSMNFVENRRESLAVIENELKRSSETHL